MIKLFKTLMVLFVLSIVVLFALSRADNQSMPPAVDNELRSDVHNWQAFVEASGIELPESWYELEFIEYNLPDAGTAGQYYANQRTVIIKPGLEEYQQLAIVYHELGHAVFDLEHKGGTLMDCKLQDESFYKENWESLRKDYINQIKQSQ